MQTTSQRAGKVLHISQLLPEQLREPVPFDLVELTEEEEKQAIELAIEEAKVKKHARLEDERKKRLAEERRNDARVPWAPGELYQLVRWRATQIIRSRTGDPKAEFEPAPIQKDVVLAMTLYFTGTEEFEKLNPILFNSTKLPFSLNKGLWLWGNPGVGKTLLMEIFNRNKRICYDVVECAKIAYRYVKEGDDAIGYLTSEIKTTAPDASTFFQPIKGICYNDLGTENLKANHYGNPLNVMEFIFLQTYEKKVPYWQRFVTTNLTFDQVKEAYGVRMLDRIKECFNILEIKGSSLRK
jgi:DNA replication protein DnaC